MSAKAESRAVGYGLVAAAASSWGTWPLIMHAAHARGTIAQELVSFVVMVAITVVPIPLLVRDRVKTKAPVVAWLGVLWLGLSDAANVALFFGAYARTSVAVAVLTHYLAPLFVAVAAPLVLGERARRSTYVALVVALAGLCLVLAPWRASFRPADLVGALFGAGSAIFYASNVIVSKRVAPHFSATELMVFHGLVGLPFLAWLVPSGAWSEVSSGSLWVVALAGVGPGALSGLVFTWGLRRVPASHASTLTLLEPLVAVASGVLFLGEALGLVGVVGALVVLFGAWLVLAGKGRETEGRDLETKAL